jgi:hypothetical protein
MVFFFSLRLNKNSSMEYFEFKTHPWLVLNT